MTTSQKEFIECAYTEYLPPAYERKTAEKKIIDENELWEYDVKTFKSRIGLYTNIGTELFAMLALFEEGSKEYNEVLNRLKICNCLQSMEIDRAKGIQTMDMPKYWTVWQHIEETDTEEEKQLKELHQKTIVDKRPYFFRYLYQDYNQKYKDKEETYNNYYESKFGESSEDILSTGSYSGEYKKIKENYHKYGELLDSSCVMNNICHYMEKNVQEIKANNRLKSFDYKTIIDPSKFHAKNKVVIQNIYDKYRQYRATINYRTTSSGFENMMQWLRNEAEDIIFSSEEIVWWASQFGTGFVIDVFGEDLKNVLKERCNGIVVVPYKSDIGHILYMGSKYKIEKFLI